jgi:hypothetical protein
MREIYTCPDHGAIAYGAQNVTVQEWNELSLARFVRHAAAPSWAKSLESQGVEHFGHA